MMAVWCAARDLTGSAGAASVATAGVGLSVPFFFQTFTIYPDGPAAVALPWWCGWRSSGQGR